MAARGQRPVRRRVVIVDEAAKLGREALTRIRYPLGTPAQKRKRFFRRQELREISAARTVGKGYKAREEARDAVWTIAKAFGAVLGAEGIRETYYKIVNSPKFLESWKEIVGTAIAGGVIGSAFVGGKFGWRKYAKSSAMKKIQYITWDSTTRAARVARRLKKEGAPEFVIKQVRGWGERKGVPLKEGIGWHTEIRLTKDKKAIKGVAAALVESEKVTPTVIAETLFLTDKEKKLIEPRIIKLLGEKRKRMGEPKKEELAGKWHSELIKRVEEIREFLKPQPLFAKNRITKEAIREVARIAESINEGTANEATATEVAMLGSDWLPVLIRLVDPQRREVVKEIAGVLKPKKKR